MLDGVGTGWWYTYAVVAIGGQRGARIAGAREGANVVVADLVTVVCARCTLVNICTAKTPSAPCCGQCPLHYTGIPLQVLWLAFNM